MWNPGPPDRIDRNLIGQDSQRRFGEVGGRRAAAKQRRHDQLVAPVGVEIGEANSVDGRLDRDRVYRPRIAGRLAAREPLERAAGARVRGTPVGRQREIQLAVAVDIGLGDRDVVLLGRMFDDRVELPIGVSQPDDSLGIDDHDIELAVVIHIDQPRGIADRQPIEDLLHAELELSGRPDRGQQQRDSQAGRRAKTRTRHRNAPRAPRIVNSYRHRRQGQVSFNNSRASWQPAAGRPYSLAVTRARAASCRQRKAGRVAANSSLTVR